MSEGSGLWSDSVGEYSNTVGLYERRPGGNIYVRYPDGKGGYTRKSLGHDNKKLAKAEAKEISAKIQRGDEAIQRGEVSVSEVLELYRDERLHRLTEDVQTDEKRRIKLWKRFLGPDSDPHAVGIGEWERFIDLRGSGRIDAQGRKVETPKERREVKPATVRKDLQFLSKVFRWASRYRVSGGADYLMRENPVRGLEYPQSTDTRRPVASPERLRKMREAAVQVTMHMLRNGSRTETRSYMLEILDLVAFAGRRYDAVRRLRYMDLKLESTDRAPHGRVRWPKVSDKQKGRWVTPLNEPARAAIDRVLEDRPGVGEAWMFPGPDSPEKPVHWRTLHDWFVACEEIAELEHREQGGFHEYRRMWATERKHLPVQDVAKAGGWKDVRTLQRLYQQADESGVLEAVQAGPKPSE